MTPSMKDESVLDEIRAMAELFYTPDEIAENLNMDPDEFRELIASRKGEVYRAFRTGWLTGDIKLRKGIALAAEHGSNPAQVMLKQIRDESEIKLKANE